MKAPVVQPASELPNHADLTPPIGTLPPGAQMVICCDAASIMPMWSPPNEPVK